MTREHSRICEHCRSESRHLALRQHEVGPSPDGHCSLCGSLYCQRCLRPLLPDDPTRQGTGLKIVGDVIYCTYKDCGASYGFGIDGAGQVVLSPPSPQGS
jgi:hypothetical protein